LGQSPLAKFTYEKARESTWDKMRIFVRRSV
jgi:hypothetical protein